MSEPLDTLRVEIVADTDKLENALNNLPRTAQNAANRTENALDGIGDAANDSARDINTLNNALGDMADTAQTAGRESASAVGGVGAAAGSASPKVGGLGGALGALAGGWVGVLATAAAAIGAIGAAAVVTSRDLSVLNKRFGETGGELQKAAQELFATGATESLGAAVDAITDARVQFQGLAIKDLPEVAAGVARIADAFGQDFGKTAQAAQALMKEFGLSSSDALALVTKGFRDGLDANGDFLDATSEYAPQFKQAGATASQFFSAMKTGLGGVALGTDRVSDLFKELQQLFVDSKRSKPALEELGLSFEEIKKSVDSGKTSMAQYFELVRDKLKGLKSPTDQQRLGIELLGTQFEDMGRAAVFAVDVSGKSFNDLGKSIDLLGKKPISAAEQWRSATAQMQLALKPLGDSVLIFASKVLPKITDAIKGTSSAFAAMRADMARVSAMFAAIGAAVAPLGKILSPVLQVWGANIGAMLGLLKSLVFGVVDGVTAIAKVFSGDFQGALNSAVRGFGGVVQSFNNLVNKMTFGILERMADFAISLYDAGKNAGMALVDGFKSTALELNRQLVQLTGGILGNVSAPSKYVAPKRVNTIKPADIPTTTAPKPTAKPVAPKPTVSKPIYTTPTNTAALAKQFAIDPKQTTAALDAAKKAAELAKKEAVAQQKAIESASKALETSISKTTSAAVDAGKVASEALKKQRAEVLALFTSASKTAQGLAGRGQFDASAISTYNAQIAEAVKLAKQYNLGNDKAVKTASNNSDAVKASAKVLNEATLKRIALIEQQKKAVELLATAEREAANDATVKAARALTDTQLKNKLAAQQALLKQAASPTNKTTIDIDRANSTIEILKAEQLRRDEVEKEALAKQKERKEQQAELFKQQKKEIADYVNAISQLRKSALKDLQEGRFDAEGYAETLAGIQAQAVGAGFGQKAQINDAIKAAETWGKKAVEWNKAVAKEIILRGEQEKLASQKADNALAKNVANASTPQLKQALSVASTGKTADFEKYNLVFDELEARSKAIANLSEDLANLKQSADEAAKAGRFDAEALKDYKDALADIAKDASLSRVAVDLADGVTAAGAFGDQMATVSARIVDAQTQAEKLAATEKERLSAVQKLAEAESKARVENLKSADIVALSKAATTSTAAWTAELNRLGLTADEAISALARLGAGKAMLEQAMLTAKLNAEYEELSSSAIPDLEKQLADLKTAVEVIDPSDTESARKYIVVLDILGKKYEDLAKTIKETAVATAEVLGAAEAVVSIPVAQRVTPLQDAASFGSESVWAKYRKNLDDTTASTQLLILAQEKLGAIVANDQDLYDNLTSQEDAIQANLAKTIKGGFSSGVDSANAFELQKQTLLNPIKPVDFSRLLTPEIEAWIASADETNSTMADLTRAVDEINSRKTLGADLYGSEAVADPVAVAKQATFWDTLTSSLAGVFASFDLSGVASSITASLNPVTALFGGILQRLAPTFEALLKPIADVAVIIADAFKPALMALAPLFEGLAPIVRVLGESLGKVLVPIFKLFADILKPLLPVLKFFADIIGAIVNVISGVLNFFTGIANSIIGFLFPSLSTPAVSTPNANLDAIQAAQSSTGNGVDVNVTVNNVYQMAMSEAELLRIQRMTTATINDVLVQTGLIQRNTKGGI